ncbi:MAG: endopeptidase La [Firmicutes bacterium]|nr:endopeptidase La [Bacillota bacterium]MCL2256351.1 endopeptidase La [Bacillota bacterium]
MIELEFMEEFLNEIIEVAPIKERTYKMITMRGIVVFPGQSLNFDLSRDKSLLAAEGAINSGEEIFLVSQKNLTTMNPAPKDINRIGTLVTIKQVMKLPNDNLRILVVGRERKEIGNYVSMTPYFEVTLKDFPNIPSNPIEVEAMKRRVSEQIEEYKRLNPKLPPDVMVSLNIFNIRSFVGIVGTYLIKDDATRQKLLEIQDEYSQLEEIYRWFFNECEIMHLEKKIATKAREAIDKNHKEYFLREQIKAIHNELGDIEDEINEYKKRMEEKKLPEKVVEKLKKELIKIEKATSNSPELGVSRAYVEWILDLPWNEKSENNLDLKLARKILEEDHYGIEKIKQRIVEFLAVHKLTNTLKAPILCFVGPPGVGKTSIVSSIAKSAGKELVTMSLGGVRDEAEIRGHRKTYIGSMPGRIIAGMKQAGVNNPVFLLDEIDKMSSDFRGDPASAMLEVLDPNQNHNFKDHYIEVPYDLSSVMFLATANYLEDIPSPLLDRMEIIELSGYTYEEKLEIAKKYLLPKQIKANGLEEKFVTIADKVMLKIISSYTRESGVRNLEREIGAICRKIAVKIVEKNIDKSKKVKVSEKDLEEYLGVPKFKSDKQNEEDEIGLSTGLAWTSVGGTTLSIEVALIPDGKGDMVLTGSLGDVMRESAQTALTLVKTRANEFNISHEAFKNNDIHIHFPEGATPKDGPSAGITIATALLSAFANRKVDKNVAMTGEVTLRGRVLSIGGLKEKSLAAFRHGIKKIIIPSENEKDVTELPNEVKDNLEIVLADTIDTVFQSALVSQASQQ